MFGRVAPVPPGIRPPYVRTAPAYTRPVATEDGDEIVVDVIDQVTDEVVEALASLVPQLSSSSDPLTTATVSEIAAGPATTLFVARAAGHIVGTLTLAVFPIPTGRRAWIEDVVVDDAARGRGAGAALVRAAVEYAASLGCRTVDLTSRPSRQAANRLYAQLGFTQRQTNVYRLSVEDLAGL
jgi:ribosomal protein S18 acetylase RimI-like enzyme